MWWYLLTIKTILLLIIIRKRIIICVFDCGFLLMVMSDRVVMLRRLIEAEASPPGLDLDNACVVPVYCEYSTVTMILSDRSFVQVGSLCASLT